MVMPLQKPGSSRQDYQTPPEFYKALCVKLGVSQCVIDLAASRDNSLCANYYNKEEDALTQSWSFEGWAYCNPPFGDIAPWVEKAYVESQKGAHVAMLLPASVGSNWYANWGHGKAHVLFVSPRLTFVGCEAPYPKDVMVLLYMKYVRGGYECWNWRKA